VISGKEKEATKPDGEGGRQGGARFRTRGVKCKNPSPYKKGFRTRERDLKIRKTAAPAYARGGGEKKN